MEDFLLGPERPPLLPWVRNGPGLLLLRIFFYKMNTSTEANSNDYTVKSHQSSTLPSQQQPQPVHQSDADEEDENVKQLGDCSSLYLSLQDCLVKTDRNWKSCQKEVQVLKACNEGRKREK